MMSDRNRKKKVVRPENNPRKYPRISMRIDAELRRRLDLLKSKSGLSDAQIFLMALRRHLPDLEKFHA